MALNFKHLKNADTCGMEPNILFISYDKGMICDLENSKFCNSMELSSSFRNGYDIAVIFQNQDQKQFIEKIAGLTRVSPEMEIIAAMAVQSPGSGVQALRAGASDFFTLPSTADILDFYIKRALERIYLHKHLCFNENCYESKFARSKKNYQQLFDQVPCFVFVQDRDYQITDANKRFKEYFGDHIGEYCFGICKNRDEPCSACPMRQTFEDGTGHTSEMEIISSDGIKHVVLSWTAPIRNHHGKITNVLVMLTDITEVRRLESHLTSLGFMIGSISHGIKGLLTALDGGMYLMDTGLKTENRDKMIQGFEISKQTTSRIKKLVLDILYYTKTRNMDWKKISIRRFMQDTINIVSGKAEKYGITLSSSADILTRDDVFEIDEPSFQAAMVNILENAVEACSESMHNHGHNIRFTARADREKVVFRIQDTGPGMDETTLKNIFTIFFSSKGNKGTGLGLFITGKVVEQHRGKIKVTSVKGKGANFKITIPRSVPETAKNPHGIAAKKN